MNQSTAIRRQNKVRRSSKAAPEAAVPLSPSTEAEEFEAGRVFGQELIIETYKLLLKRAKTYLDVYGGPNDADPYYAAELAGQLHTLRMYADVLEGLTAF
jgi:hypothetical protein